MRLLSINISPVREFQHNGRTVHTGIYKTPVRGPILARTLGLEGDGQAEKSHGGPDMALYAFTSEHYTHWSKVLSRDDLHPGKFGENLTVEGMPEDQVCIGDRFAIGEIEVEVSLPRAPCSKLAMAMNDPLFPKTFLATCNVGFYLRVKREGRISPGDPITKTHAHPARLTINQITRIMYFDLDNKSAAAEAARIDALAETWKSKLRARA